MRQNQKGFSLVELIIVIAIMAVLIGVLAPQYLKYVNNARVTTDMRNASEMARIIDATMSGTQGTLAAGTISGAGGTAVSNVDNLTALPYSELKRDAVWNITIIQGIGVTEITLDSVRIYPGEGDNNPYYAAYYQH